MGVFDEHLTLRLVTHDEARESEFRPRDLVNRFKQLIDTNNRWRLMNVKYGGKQMVLTNTCYFLSANETTALTLDEDDRRALVVLSKRPPRDAAHYAALHHWFEHENGAELVCRWLAQRWDGMSDARRLRLQGVAPRTPERLAVIRSAESPVKTALRELIDDDSDEARRVLPDVTTAADVVDTVGTMVQSARGGLPRGLRVPAGKAMGAILRELGAVAVNDGDPVWVPDRGAKRLLVLRRRVDYPDQNTIVQAYLDQNPEAGSTLP
jgi:hypothetical protein